MLNECFTMWQGVALVSLAKFDIRFCSISGLSRQLSMLRIIQAAWIPTFAQFMRCLSLRAGKLLNKVLPKCGCTTFQKVELIVNVVLLFDLVAYFPWNMFISIFLLMHIYNFNLIFLFSYFPATPLIPVLAQISQVPKHTRKWTMHTFQGKFPWLLYLIFTQGLLVRNLVGR